MNRRLAAHQSRKGLSVVGETESTKAENAITNRAAEAAARVAARYAHAPSYSEMQAAEARAALRAAEAATRTALEAQAAARAALDQLANPDQALDDEEPHSDFREKSEPIDVTPHAHSERAISTSGQPIQIRFEPDMPVLPSAAAAADAPTSSRGYVDYDEKPRYAVREQEDFAAVDSVQIVDPGEPINANLIQFPRVLVATRRVRPRLGTDYPSASQDQSPQLSIFEVDPSTISTAPPASAGESRSAAQTAIGPEWSGMKLDAQAEDRKGTEHEPAPAASTIELAPLSSRLLAVAVDAALIVGLVSVAGALLAGWLNHFPGIRAAEFGAVGAILLTAIVYHLLFFMRIEGTPGMKYAHIALCTFDDENPTREQLRSRLIAMMLSLLPVGLGVAWALFDDDHLSWHDRISGTYLRAY